MSENAIDKVQNTFKINQIQTAIIGGTIISLHPTAGAGDAMGANSGNPTVPLDSLQLMNLYPELAGLENEQGNPLGFMGLSTIWNVGFTSSHEKMLTPDYLGMNSAKYLKNRRLRTVDQLFTRRSETGTAAFFGCFQLKGAKNPVVSSLSTSSDIDEYKRYGLICDRWVNNPQTICYAVSQPNEKNDYLYLIGSDVPEIFEAGAVLPILLELDKSIFSLNSELGKKSAPNDINSLHRTLSDPSNVWKSVATDKISEDTLQHPLIKIGFHERKMIRIIHGVFNYFNYLLHAHKHLNLTNIYEVNGDTLGKTVKILELLNKYAPVYKYCKNRVLYK